MTTSEELPLPQLAEIYLVLSETKHADGQTFLTFMCSLWPSIKSKHFACFPMYSMKQLVFVWYFWGSNSKIIVLWGVTPCGLVHVYRYFGGTPCLLLKGLRLRLKHVLQLLSRGKKVCSPETSVNIYQSTRHHITEDFCHWFFFLVKLVAAFCRFSEAHAAVWR